MESTKVDVRIASEIAFEPVKVPAIKGNPNAEDERITIYNAEIPANVVAQFHVSRVFEESTGFQREFDPNRVRQIGRLMGGNKASNEMPTPNIHGGLLAFIDAKDVEFTRGTLTLNAPPTLIDGQHRAKGAAWAVTLGATSDYTESVRIIVGATHAELALWYLRANLEARKVAPSNILANVATMSGVVMGKKSWIARLVLALSESEPLVVNNVKLVGFKRGDAGRLAPNTLYRFLDVLLPTEMNAEGKDASVKAGAFAYNALVTYSEQFPNWGTLDEKGKLANLISYSFTMLLAYAHLYRAAYTFTKDEDETRKVVADAYEKANLTAESIANFGAGESAAKAVANYIAGKGDLPAIGKEKE